MSGISWFNIIQLKIEELLISFVFDHELVVGPHEVMPVKIIFNDFFVLVVQWNLGAFLSVKVVVEQVWVQNSRECEEGRSSN